MSALFKPTDVFYFSSVLYRSDLYSKEDILSLFEQRFGSEHSHIIPKTNPLNNYYSKEMGEADLLKRVMICSMTPESREDFVGHKLWATEFEIEYTQDNARMINWDIGQLSLENFLLATGKNYSHRIYLKDGVFADMTLEFKQGEFRSFDWTYPDYTDSDKLEFLTLMRDLLRRKIA